MWESKLILYIWWDLELSLWLFCLPLHFCLLFLALLWATCTSLRILVWRTWVVLHCIAFEVVAVGIALYTHHTHTVHTLYTHCTRVCACPSALVSTLYQFEWHIETLPPFTLPFIITINISSTYIENHIQQIFCFASTIEHNFKVLKRRKVYCIHIFTLPIVLPSWCSMSLWLIYRVHSSLFPCSYLALPHFHHPTGSHWFVLCICDAVSVLLYSFVYFFRYHI